MGRTQQDEMVSVYDDEMGHGERYLPGMDGREPQKEATPDELTTLLAQLGDAKEFWVTIKRHENGKKVHCGKRVSIIPDPDQIGEEFGAGDYILTVSWPVPGQKAPRWQNLYYNLDSSYNEKHRAWVASRSPVNTVAANIETDLERLAKMQSIFGGKKEDNSTGLILEMVKEQNRQTERRMDSIQSEMKEDRKATQQMFKDLIGSLKEMNSHKAPEKSFIEQLREYKEISGALGFDGKSNDAPVDDRPVWMQAIEMIGDRALPLLEAFSKTSGLKRGIAERQVEKVMDPQNPIIAQIMAKGENQSRFITEMIAKATTPESKIGLQNLAAKLGIALPDQIRG